MLTINEELLYSKNFSFDQLSIEAKEDLLHQSKSGISSGFPVAELTSSLERDLENISGFKGLQKLGYRFDKSLIGGSIVPNFQNWMVSFLGIIVGLALLWMFAPSLFVDLFSPERANFSMTFILGVVLKFLFSLTGFVYALISTDSLISLMSFSIYINKEDGTITYNYLHSLKKYKEEIDSPSKLEIIETEKHSFLIMNTTDGQQLKILKGTSRLHNIILRNVKNQLCAFIKA